MRRQPAATMVCLLVVSSFLLPACDDASNTPDERSQGTVRAALTVADCVPSTPNGKVVICHATSSAANPFKRISISVNACLNAHVNHAGDEAPDCAGVCGGSATVDCAGVCNGSAAVDCEGVCGGTAVVGGEGACCQPSELDCAGICGGSAVIGGAGACCQPSELDCAEICNGGAAAVDDVYFTTNGGVFYWSSDTGSITPLSSYPSYAIAISPAGDIFVGTGGIEAQATGIPELAAPGIHSIDGGGMATLVSATAAEDLQFAPDGVLHAANSTGIYSIATDGTATSRSTNATSQFAFDSLTTVVTTNGIVYGTIFGYRTDRVFLDTPNSTLLNGDGGEDIKVLAGGEILLCGQSGIVELLPSGAFSSFLSGMAVFNFGVTGEGDVYIGNTDLYGAVSWPQGLFELPVGASTVTLLDAADINALVVVEDCR